MSRFFAGLHFLCHSWRRFCLWCLVLAVSCVLIPGCLPALLSRKAAAQEAKGAKKSELIKPTVADDSQSRDAEDKSNPGSDGAGEPSDPVSRVSTTDSKEKEFTDSDPSAELSKLKKIAADDKKRSDGAKPAANPDKKDADDSASERASRKEPQKPHGTETKSETDKGVPDFSFRKHDHSKYVTLIRNKAIDRVNKEKNSDLARLCRDRTTDQWSLTIYRRADKSYSFIYLVWDEIDEKWEESYSADRRPISGWKQHLDFSASGKECKVLKGNPER